MAKEREYMNIRNRVSITFCTEDKLNLIKDHFRQTIDSARRYDRIHNLNELLRILEKRDILSTEDIRPLRYLAEILQRDDILRLIDAFDLIQEPVQNQPFPRNGVLPEANLDLVENIFDIICRDIGQKWKPFARKLQIPEGCIDDLEQHHSMICDRVREILNYHRRESDERYWKVDICNALKEARRNDLSIVVERLFARHGLM